MELVPALKVPWTELAEPALRRRLPHIDQHRVRFALLALRANLAVKAHAQRDTNPRCPLADASF